MPHGGRHMFWVDTITNTQVASGAKSETSLMTGISSTESRMGMTLMRLILCYSLGRTIMDSGEGIDLVSIGIGIASQEAFAGGVLADPESSAEFPMGGWLYRCRYAVHGFATNAQAVFQIQIDKDLGAKRKLNNGELYITVTNQAGNGIAGFISLIGATRALFLST